MVGLPIPNQKVQSNSEPISLAGSHPSSKLFA